MNEKPILFNTEMVKAILEGRKTVTRRVIKPRYRDGDAGFWVQKKVATGEITGIEIYDEEECGTERYVKPPYQVGDILYVRETWGFDNHNWLYKADFSDEDLIKLKRLLIWHPSIHMPKKAARIFLRVTDVRVERLQEMKTVDFQKEGMQANSIPDWWNIIKQKFRKLWDSTVPKKDLDENGWDANPWVWVIEFERIEK